MFLLMNYTQIGWVFVLAKQKAIINSNKKHAPHSALASILFLEKRKGKKSKIWHLYSLERLANNSHENGFAFQKVAGCLHFLLAVLHSFA